MTDTRTTEEITVRDHREPVTVRFHEVVVASSERARELREPGHDPVLYIPFDDIYFVHMQKTTTQTECPRKGVASYWRIVGQGTAAEDAVWTYEDPNPSVAPIKGYAAFDPSKVSFE
ncbi:DUF427 domain-containing protein [Phyllobacterium salinisoli]|uniref:DUF427 domain-containing protein n=1 Tax=Phyllobacterium salinisoli TaxID=1899321 RepID=A0A368K6W6_9HYPH|nr:DUF427 domain-containing protein [Phyllobacterium salinisoli]RCS25117.1 DUF427 domain-containing protein [Phyllobacterium salinisoli]